MEGVKTTGAYLGYAGVAIAIGEAFYFNKELSKVTKDVETQKKLIDELAKKIEDTEKSKREIYGSMKVELDRAFLIHEDKEHRAMEPGKKKMIMKIKSLEARVEQLCDMVDYLRSQQGSGDIQSGPPLPPVGPNRDGPSFNRGGMKGGPISRKTKKPESDDEDFDNDDLMNEVEGRKGSRY